MNRIKLLDKKTSDLISAGEVVERPANALKELIENSIDSGATNIEINLVDGGVSKIQVIDNGRGITKDDLELSVQRFATSKISEISDLDSLDSLGFRGEALSSIAAVSRLSIHSGVSNSSAYCCKVFGGEIISTLQTSQRRGTEVIVDDIFYNIPARKKFLKSTNTEFRACMSVLNSQIVANFTIAFRVVHNDKQILNISSSSTWMERVQLLYKQLDWKHIVPVSYSDSTVVITGFVSKPEAMTKKRNNQLLIVNNRIVQNKSINQAIYSAFNGMVIHGLSPVSFLNISINPSLIDINVHPKKTEIKFGTNIDIYNVVYRAVHTSVLSTEKVVHYNKEIHDNTLDKPISLSFDIPDSDIVFSKNNDSKHDLEEKNIVQYKLLGQLKNSYILIETSEEFWIVDQHAAHERIQYEKLKSNYDSHKIESQKLLLPVSCKLSIDEKIIMEENGNILSKLGFEFDYLDEETLVIESIPDVLSTAKINSDTITNLIDDFSTFNKSTKKLGLIDNKLKSIACRSSIMFGDKLTDAEMMDIVLQVVDLKIPYCPHGRPAIVKLSDLDMMKMFKRVI